MSCVRPDIPLLYLDNHVIAVVKPAGLPVQPDASTDRDLLSILKAFLKQRFSKPGNVYLGMVQRLDRPVSGVMLFARTSKAAARLSAQFRDRTPTKRYLAIVEAPLQGNGRCRHYLAKTGRQVRVVPAAHPQARDALLDWRSLATAPERALLDISLHTGRAHQIRVQLAHVGAPILGDLRYGATQEFDGRNLALHCYRLACRHPIDNRLLGWTADPPGTWQGLFDDAIRAHLSTCAETTETDAP